MPLNLDVLDVPINDQLLSEKNRHEIYLQVKKSEFIKPLEPLSPINKT